MNKQKPRKQFLSKGFVFSVRVSVNSVTSVTFAELATTRAACHERASEVWADVGHRSSVLVAPEGSLSVLLLTVFDNVELL